MLCVATQISNGTWTITCPPGPNAVNFAGAEITPTVFYFDQQHFPSGAVGEVNYTSTDTTITITSHVNGVPCNLWWQIWVRPKVAPRPISLAGIAADGAAGCPLYKGEHWCNSTSVWAECVELPHHHHHRRPPLPYALFAGVSYALIRRNITTSVATQAWGVRRRTRCDTARRSRDRWAQFSPLRSLW